MASKNRHYSFFNRSKALSLAERGRVASSFWQRLRGLLGYPPLADGQGLLIEKCPSIHMFGMAYPIDVVFVSRQNVVVGLVENIAPGKVSPYFKDASYCLELPAGTICDTGTGLGDAIDIVAVSV